jgi:integrase
LTVEELERLRTALAKCRNGLLSNVIMFAIHTGMRRGEILSIRWSDINFDASTAHLADTKNGDARTVPLSSSALAALPATDNHAAGERVFPLSPNAVRLAWERLKRRAGVNDLHFHDLRHEAISRFFELGLSIPEVALISGHRDFKMLFRYTHLRPADVAKKLGQGVRGSAVVLDDSAPFCPRQGDDPACVILQRLVFSGDADRPPNRA